MRKKLSYRKKVIIEVLAPTIIILLMAIIRVSGTENNYFLIDSAMLFAILLFIIVIYTFNRKNYEPEDEMARQNHQKADGIAFNLVLVVIVLVMVYSQLNSWTVTFSTLTFVLIFAAMKVVSLVLFLYYDIRGN